MTRLNGLLTPTLSGRSPHPDSPGPHPLLLHRTGYHRRSPKCLDDLSSRKLGGPIRAIKNRGWSECTRSSPCSLLFVLHRQSRSTSRRGSFIRLKDVTSFFL